MDIQVTFHQMEPSEAIKDYCQKKMDKLVKYYSRISSAKIVLEIIKLEHHVSVVLGLPQRKVVKASANQKNDMYRN